MLMPIKRMTAIVIQNNTILIPTSILKLLGNGAVDELLKYCRISKQRGDFDPWKTVS